MQCKYTYKKWQKRKVKKMLIIYPFYSHEKLMKITGCTKEELIDFEIKFKKEIKWLR